MRWPAALLALLVTLLLAACQPVLNPARGTVEASLITPEQERALGAREHLKVLASFGGAYDDPAFSDYVARIGLRVVAASDVPDQLFTFTVLDSPVVNAFALPGGYVYVTRGLLALAEDEAEVAAVLAHEIGHVAARHAAERQQAALGAQLGAAAATILGAVLLGDKAADLVAQLAGLGASAWLAGYSREQEREADRLAVRYLVRAGYDPAALARILSALEAWDGLRADLGEAGGAKVPEFLSTHPRTPERVRVALNLAAAAPGGDRRRDAWLDHVDGLVFGDGPKQGWVEGRTFLHPDLGFAFELPPGFEVENRPDAVIAKGPGDTVLLFSLAPENAPADPAFALRRLLADIPHGQIRRILTAQGFEAAVAPLRSGRAAGWAAALDDGRRIYTVLLLAPRLPARFVLLDVLDSFRRISAAACARLSMRVIRVVQVPAAGAGELVRRMAVERLPARHLLVLNGRRDLSDFRPGERVKIVAGRALGTWCDQRGKR